MPLTNAILSGGGESDCHAAKGKADDNPAQGNGYSGRALRHAPCSEPN
jgi:hypothetical protein